MLMLAVVGMPYMSNAQVGQYQVSNKTLIVSGSYSEPTAYPSPRNEWWFPFYTATDSVKGSSATDTFKAHAPGLYQSLYTWCHVNNYIGTTGTVVSLWVSADSGKGTDFVPIYTTTVTPTGTNVVSYSFGNYWLYTNYWWIIKENAGESSWWYSGVMGR